MNHKFRLVKSDGISLRPGVYSVTFEREGPHGLLYYVQNEWYAARRFEPIDSLTATGENSNELT